MLHVYYFRYCMFAISDAAIQLFRTLHLYYVQSTKSKDDEKDKILEIENFSSSTIKLIKLH